MYAVGIIFSIWITRLIFSIRTFLNHQRVRTKLMIEIALKHGVDPDRISGILNENDMQDYSKSLTTPS